MKASQGSKVKPYVEEPRLPANMNETSEPPELQDRDTFEGVRFSGCEVAGRDANRVSFEGVVFDRVVFRDNELERLELMDVVFDRCDLSNARLGGANLHRVEFRGCKLMGLDLSESMLRNVRFMDCQAELAGFRFADMKRVSFENGNWRGADFYTVKIEQVRFEQLQLDGAQLAGTKLAGLDLSDCEFQTLGVEADNLRGCVIAPHQAAVFANLFGLIVKE